MARERPGIRHRSAFARMWLCILQEETQFLVLLLICCPFVFHRSTSSQYPTKLRCLHTQVFSIINSPSVFRVFAVFWKISVFSTHPQVPCHFLPGYSFSQIQPGLRCGSRSSHFTFSTLGRLTDTEMTHCLWEDYFPLLISVVFRFYQHEWECKASRQFLRPTAYHAVKVASCGTHHAGDESG